MGRVLNITSGDIAGEVLKKSGVPGEVFVWHDILYDGPAKPGWPDDNILQKRALFLEEVTGGGLVREEILKVLTLQYEKIARVREYDRLVLWFDACLFDQSMLCHILTCLSHVGVYEAELICVDDYPGIDPYHGLGQLTSEQLAGCYKERAGVRKEQFVFAGRVDRAFALQDRVLLEELADMENAEIPWVPAAVKRWLCELPDPATGLGKLESLAMEAVKSGLETPGEIFSYVSGKDNPPVYWGDITLWGKINALAGRNPPRLVISGPEDRLPQWEGGEKMKHFRILLPGKSSPGVEAPVP